MIKYFSRSSVHENYTLIRTRTILFLIKIIISKYLPRLFLRNSDQSLRNSNKENPKSFFNEAESSSNNAFTFPLRYSRNSWIHKTELGRPVAHVCATSTYFNWSAYAHRPCNRNPQRDFMKFQCNDIKCADTIQRTLELQTRRGRESANNIRAHGDTSSPLSFVA